MTHFRREFVKVDIEAVTVVVTISQCVSSLTTWVSCLDALIEGTVSSLCQQATFYKGISTVPLSYHKTSQNYGYL